MKKNQKNDFRKGYVQAVIDWFNNYGENGIKISDMIYEMGANFRLSKKEILEVLDGLNIQPTRDWVKQYDGGDNCDDIFTVAEMKEMINDAVAEDIPMSENDD